MSSTTDHATALPATSATGAHEPIAIIGIGCRFPGAADTPAAFWKLLSAGVDAIGEVPNTRFDIERYYDPRPATPGHVMSRWGGFLDQIDHFDAAFFGIAPREADRLDPQQRLLLETAWEAMEDAGQTPDRLSAGPTGVFVGMWLNDYEARMFADPAQADFYMTIGSGRYSASGRISYAFDFQGPSMTIDTACSSSLVAVHLACQSIWSGESAVAFAGGANIILQPQITIAYSQSKMMATDGHCKFGDASANGYVRSEGAAVVMLKPLAQAQAAGDPIYAVIRGSAVTNDGRSSGFLATPGQPGQEEMLRRAYANANVDPRDVQYVEAHGTGTRVGDPVEVGALGAVLGAGRDAAHPCIVGSVKTNIGHTEGAAGLAGLIKVALSLKHRQIPATLHLREPNPAIPWDDLRMVVRSEMLDWPSDATPALAGVSAFGIAGTNAHVVLEEAPRSLPAAPARAADHAQLLALSAKTPDALRALAERYQTVLQAQEQPADLRDICFSAATRRSHHEHRLAVVGAKHSDMAEQLAAFLDGQSRSGMTVGRTSTQQAAGVVFVFPGQGSQWFGMGRRLLAAEPVFRAAMERCDQAINAEAGWSLLAELSAEDSPRLQEIDIIQPAIFAIQVSLATLWQSWGIVPAAVVGHSMGEVAATHVAGILSLQDAVAVICRRSRLLRRISGQGMMAAVELTIAQAQAAIIGFEDELAIAVSNSPTSTVLSGDPTALNLVLEQLQRRDIFCRRIKVDVASHSPQVDPLRDELIAALADLRPQAETIPFFSTVTVAYEHGTQCDARYWERNLRQPVMFASAVQQLLDAGNSLFIEISPHPILLPAIESTFQQLGRQGQTVASLRRDCDEPATMLAALGQLYTLGYPIDWRALQGAGAQFVTLPLYPWQRERFWLDQEANLGSGGRRGAPEHRLLGWRVALAEGAGTVWEQDLRKTTRPELYDHRVEGLPLLPASAYLEFATAAADLLGDQQYELADIAFQRALFLDDDAATLIQIVLAPENAGQSVRLYSQSNTSWMLHASITLRPVAQNDEHTSGLGQLDLIRARAQTTLPGDAFYAGLAASGIGIGESLQRVTQVWQGDDEALGLISGPELGTQQPLNLDACLQMTALATAQNDGAIFMPAALDRMRFFAAPTGQIWCYIRKRAARNDDRVIQDMTLYAADGRLIAAIEGLQLQRLGAHAESLDRWLYQLEWRRAESPAQHEVIRAGEHWLVLADQAGVSAALASQLRTAGAACTLVYPGTTYARVADAAFSMNPQQPADAQRLLNEVFGATVCTGVIHLWSLDTPAGDLSVAALAAAQDAGCGSALHLVQALADRRDPPRLWLVTRAAQHAVDADQELAVAQAPLWGFGRVLAEEQPELWGGLIDIATGTNADESAAALLAELGRQDGEDQVALRGDERYVARIARQPATPPTAFRWRPDATYMITGAFGAIGAHVARWMLRQGARRLILVGRTSLPARAQWQHVAPDSPQGQRIALIRELEQQGASVHVAALDVSDEAQLRGFIDTFQAEGWPPIRGVMHAAAVIEDRLITQLDLRGLHAVLGPKVIGGWLLDRMLDDLDFFVMFSSIGAILGQQGQANYAAANAFLDALAQQRRAHGRAALSVNWGVWADLGFSTSAGGQQTLQQLAQQGIAGFSAAQGLAALDSLLRQNVAPQVAVMPIDWNTLAAALPVPLLLADLAASEAGQQAKKAQAATQERFRSVLEDAAPAQRRELLETHVRQQIAHVLKLAPERIELTRPLGMLGLDSLTATELRKRLETGLEIALSATMIWNYPTVTDMVGYLAGKLALDVTGAAPSSQTPPSAAPISPLQNAGIDAIGEIEELSDEEAMRLLLGGVR